MMVRLDKILHIITCFKIDSNLIEDYQYSSPPKDTKISNKSFILLQRMGVVSRGYKLKSIKQDIIKSIPFGRENFLLENLDKLTRSKCIPFNPKCGLCILNEECDYNNRKNDWMIN